MGKKGKRVRQLHRETLQIDPSKGQVWVGSKARRGMMGWSDYKWPRDAGVK